MAADRIPVVIGWDRHMTSVEPSSTFSWDRLRFTLEDIDDKEFLWCDGPGERTGAISLGISLVPVDNPGVADDELSRGGIYLDITLDEIVLLQAQLQRVIDDNTELPCSRCGSTETVEMTDERPDGREQSITICAACGYDG